MNSIDAQIDGATIALGAQLGTSAGLVLVMVVIHSLGLVGVSNALHLGGEELKALKKKTLDARSIALLGTMGLLLFALHMLEIFVFAGFYLAVGGMQTLEEALFYSASAYATLGLTVENFPREWRLIGAIEALIGFLLIGWSTAFMVGTMNRLRD